MESFKKKTRQGVVLSFTWRGCVSSGPSLSVSVCSLRTRLCIYYLGQATGDEREERTGGRRTGGRRTGRRGQGGGGQGGGGQGGGGRGKEDRGRRTGEKTMLESLIVCASMTRDLKSYVVANIV